MARKLKVDMTGVENFVRCQEGEHIVTLKEIEEKVSESSGNDMLAATFEVTKGSSAGAKLYENFVLTEKALWKLKGYLEAVGLKSEGKLVIDLDKLVGKTCIASVEIEEEEYNGKTTARARIQQFKKLEASKDDDEEYEDDDEAPPPPPKKTPPKDDKKKDDKKKTPPKKQEEDDEDDWEET